MHLQYLKEKCYGKRWSLPSSLSEMMKWWKDWRRSRLFNPKCGSLDVSRCQKNQGRQGAVDGIRDLLKACQTIFPGIRPSFLKQGPRWNHGEPNWQMPWGAQVPTSSWAGNPVACFKATATSNRNFGGGLERRGCIPLVTSGGKKTWRVGRSSMNGKTGI